jgi:hypothetical protein
MPTSYELCWNPSLGSWEVKWRVGVECQRLQACQTVEVNETLRSYSHRQSSGYELNVVYARLCFSMIYVGVSGSIFMLFLGVLFPICSSSCSQSLRC